MADEKQKKLNKPGFKLDKKFREVLSLSKKIWEKFGLEFQVCLYILYVFTSPSAENKEKLFSFRVDYFSLVVL